MHNGTFAHKYRLQYTPLTTLTHTYLLGLAGSLPQVSALLTLTVSPSAVSALGEVVLVMMEVRMRVLGRRRARLAALGRG